MYDLMKCPETPVPCRVSRHRSVTPCSSKCSKGSICNSSLELTITIFTFCFPYIWQVCREIFRSTHTTAVQLSQVKAGIKVFWKWHFICGGTNTSDGTGKFLKQTVASEKQFACLVHNFHWSWVSGYLLEEIPWNIIASVKWKVGVFLLT